VVILAGGQARRLGGADKPGLVVDGQPLVVRVAGAAVAAGARRLIVVGPPRAGAVAAGLARAGAELRIVREDPPGGGPVPALTRGLAEVAAPWVAVLAADLPFLTGAVIRALLAAGRGAVLADDGGRPQWLAGVWPAAALRTAVDRYRGSSLGGLFGPLEPVLVSPGSYPAGPEALRPWADCDTPADLAAARAAADLAAREPGES